MSIHSILAAASVAVLALRQTYASPITRRAVDTTKPFYLQATPDLGDPTPYDLCLAQPDQPASRGTRYLGKCTDKETFTLANNALTRQEPIPLSEPPAQAAWYSDKLRLNFEAGAPVLFSVDGGLAGDLTLEGGAGGDVLAVTDVDGEFANWWMCPLNGVQDTVDVALTYGHHSDGQPDGCTPVKVVGVQA